MVRNSWAYVIVGLLLLPFAGCGSQAVSETSNPSPVQTIPVPITSIAALQKPEMRNVEVYLKGTVGDRVPILDGTVYPLQDATGTVWILTQSTAPNSGEEITVKGTVRFKSIALDGKEQGSIYVEAEK